MAGKPKASDPYEYGVAHYFLASALATNGTPKSDLLTRRVHLALLQRLRKFHPEEYRHCMEAVAIIAKFEAVDARYLAADERERGIAELLEEIAGGTPSRLQHNKILIEDQRRMLRDLFSRDKYQENPNYESRLRWFHSHWEQLQAMLVLTPCRCQYRMAFDDLRPHANMHPNDISSVAKASDFFLAFSHGLMTVSAENLSKLLKLKG